MAATHHIAHIPRSALTITFSVWRALFLREALSRLFAARASWFWLLAEPVFNVAYLLVIFTVFRVTKVGGIDTVIWLMSGMLAYFMFNRTGMQTTSAISANLALFTYRQVKPIDCLLVRAALEGFLMVLIMGILLASAALFGHSISPDDPLAVLEAFGALWLVGVGYGLVTSVSIQLVPEMSRVINLIMMPMYLLSGVIFPISAMPPEYRAWLMLNPVAHGLDAVRLGFAAHYHAVPELSMAYLYGFAISSIFLGLALHRRFALRLVTQ